MEENNQKPKVGLVIGVSVLVLIVVGAFFIFGNKKSGTQNQIATSVQPDSQVDTSKNIAIDEVGKHAVSGDCWLAIEGNVYDVSSFIPKHPGENAILQGCGKDATEMFNSRPGKGTSHSEKARGLLEDLQIGVLAGS